MTRAVVRVRPAVADDIPAVVALVRAVDAGPGGARLFAARPIPDDAEGPLTDRVRQAVEDGDRTLLVAADESGDIAGMLLARRDEVGSLDLTPVLHVTHLMVAPSCRRRGTGRALLAAAVQVAEHSGADHVSATAAAGSREANRYLARIGFAPLVVHRIAPTAVLRRSLGLHDAVGRMAVLRRARAARAQRGQTQRSQRAVRGA